MMDEALYTYLPISITPRFFILTLVFLLSSFVFWKSYVLTQLRKKHAKLAQTVENLELILNESPSAWIKWDIFENKLTCSPKALTLLKVGETKIITIETFLTLFAPDSVTFFEKKLGNLQSISEEFIMTLSLADSQCMLEIKGISLDASQRMLWIQDVTKHIQELDYQATEITELLEERNRLNTILNALPFPIWTRNKVENVTYCNNSYIQMADATQDQILSKNKLLWSGKLQSTENSWHNFHLLSLREHIVHDGQRRLYEFSEMETEDGMVGFTVDLTEYEANNLELVRHIQAHHEVLEGISVGITIYGPDKKMKFHNHAYSRLFEMDESWLQTCPTVGEVLENLRQRKLLSETVDFQSFKEKANQMFTSLLHPFQRLDHLPDGRTIRIITSPHPLGGLFYIFEDVTDRLDLERRYNTLIDVQKATLDNLYEGIAVFGSDGRLKLFNPAFARIWGLVPEEVKPGGHISHLVEHIRETLRYNNNWPEYKDKIINFVTDRVPKRRQITRKDGKVLELSYVPLPDGAHLMSYIDITDSIKAERALMEKNDALEAADKLKSEFIANVSDELRTPINQIIGNSEILVSNYVGILQDEQMTYVSSILNCSRNLMILVNDIIDLACIEAGKLQLHREQVDIYKTMRGVKTLIEDLTRRKKIEFEMICPEKIGMFFVDEKRMKQALYNLLNNAVKFTKESGKISLQVMRRNNEIIISVTDTSIGIDRKDQFRIFNTFVKTAVPDNILGTSSVGLGLPLVKSLIELHGGKVKVRSKHKGGTRVAIHLPAKNLSLVQSMPINSNFSRKVSSV